MVQRKNPISTGSGFLIILIGGVVIYALMSGGGRESTSSSTSSKPPKAKLVTYQAPFRRDYGEVAYLSLIVYFEKHPDYRMLTSPYDLRYKIKSVQTGKVFEGDKKYPSIHPCQLGYTGAKEILDAPSGYGYFTEIVLKSKQTPVKPGRLSSNDPEPIQDGKWWISKGLEYPSFKYQNYTIESVEVVERATGQVKWKL